MHMFATALRSIKLALMQTCKILLGSTWRIVTPCAAGMFVGKTHNYNPAQTDPCNQMFAKTTFNCNCCSDGNECDNFNCAGSRRSALCKILRPLSIGKNVDENQQQQHY